MEGQNRRGKIVIRVGWGDRQRAPDEEGKKHKESCQQPRGAEERKGEKGKSLYLMSEEGEVFPLAGRDFLGEGRKKEKRGKY